MRSSVARLAIVAVLALLALAGCLSAPATNGAIGPASSASGAAEGSMATPQLIDWKGHIAVGTLDMFGHDQPTEQPLVAAGQKAGFLVDIPERPSAIEVRVAWTTPGASFMLHPHFLVGDDASGTTIYYGYMSKMFTTSPGCIRVPEADLAKGTWPMMIHPSSDTKDADFTITVGIVGATGTVSPNLHGHRADGKYVIKDHESEPCQLLK